MNPTPDGPEHLPLPASTRGEARKTSGAPSASTGIPIAHAVVVLTLALAGAGVWLAGGRGTTVPAASITPRLLAPAPVMRTAPPPAVPAGSPAPILERARNVPPPVAAPKAVAPKLETTALPEPPMADESLALAPQEETMAPAEVEHLFNRSIVDFGELERRIVWYPAPRPAPRPTADPARDAPKPAAANQQCSDCNRAAPNSGSSRWVKPTDTIDVDMEYVGRCNSGGYIYRLTNHSRLTLGTIVATDGEIWRSHGIKPSQSLEIRSRKPIDDLEFSSR